MSAERLSTVAVLIAVSSFIVLSTMWCVDIVDCVPVVHSRSPRSLSGHQLALCDSACSSGDWCPLWCPEHTLFIAKRNVRPFSDEDLSFDDYVFLKMMGRSRK